MPDRAGRQEPLDFEVTRGHMFTDPPVPLVRRAGAIVVNLDDIPWTEFPIPGNQFKLLRIDEGSGSFTFYLRTEHDAPLVVHKHVGGSEVFNLRGHWQYEDRPPLGPNTYVYEPTGVIHQPTATAPGEVSEMLVIDHGCFVAYDSAGNVSAVVDAEVMYDLAAANGAVGHLPPR